MALRRRKNQSRYRSQSGDQNKKVPKNLPSDYFASFLSIYGQVEEAVSLRGGSGMANGDYAFTLCLKREGFQAILDTIQFRNLKLLMVVEGRRANCWLCCQPWHLDKDCPDKADGNKALEQPAPPENTSKFVEESTEVVRKGWKAPPPAKSASHSEGKTEEKTGEKIGEKKTGN